MFTVKSRFLGLWPRNDKPRYNFSLRSRSAFAITDTELNVIAAAASIGLSNNPKKGYGHNYTLEVTVGGEPDAQTGMVLNLADLDGVVEREILDRFDHVYLNADEEASGAKVPTTENLCVEVFNRLEGRFPGAALKRVRIEETGKNSFE